MGVIPIILAFSPQIKGNTENFKTELLWLTKPSTSLYSFPMDPDYSASFDQRGKIRVVEIVHDLLRAAVTFRGVEGHYRRGQLRFEHVEPLIDDRGQSVLYRLKENCHTLFRNTNDQPRHEEEKLLDLAIGSIFHEAMKLRENLYQVETYKPRYLEIQQRGDPSLYRRSLLIGFEKIILRAERGIPEGISEIRALLKETLDQLLEVLRGYRENDLLIRFLLSHQKLFVKVYGRKCLDRLFRSMFRKGISQVYWVGAMSYLESAYYDMASDLFTKALGLTPEDQKLKFLSKYAMGLNAYYNNNYEQALHSFKGLLELSRSFPGRTRYIQRVTETCGDIARESLAEQKRGMARQAQKMVQHFTGIV